MAGRNSRGLQRGDQAAHGPGEQQGAGARPVALARDVDHGHVEPTGRRRRPRRRSRPAKRVPPAERITDSACQAAGSVGQHALTLDAVAEVDQHRLAHAPGDAEPASGGTR